MNCPEGGALVEWTHVHDLAASADALIDALNTTGVARLLDSEEIPFRYAALPAFDGWIQFDLTTVKSGWTVVKNQLVTDWDTPWMPDHPTLFDALVGDKKQGLYLVDNEETCWCTLHWSVEGSSSYAYALKEDAEAINTGCCPTTHVPTVDDEIVMTKPYGAYNFLPVGRMMDIERRLSPHGSDPQIISVKRCTADDSTEHCKLRLEKIQGRWRITKVLRKMSGYFTWHIAGKQFRAIYDNLAVIVAACCGPRSDDVVVAAGFDCADGKLTKRCAVTVEDILWTMHCADVRHFECPGSITCEEDSTYTGGCGGVRVTMPWDEATNAAETCGEAAKIKLYRVVIQQFTDLIAKILDTMSPKTAFCACPTCAIEIQTQEGYFGSCAILTVRADNTPVEFKTETPVDIGCYAYQVVEVGIVATAADMGLDDDPSADCKARFSVTCETNPICVSSCHGCHPANNEDSTGVKRYPNGCESGEFRGIPGEVWDIDFREDCCHGQAACECAAGGDAPPS